MLRKRSAAAESRLRAEAESRRRAKIRLQAIIIRFVIGTVFITGLALGTSTNFFESAEPIIPELGGGAKELDKLIRSRDFVAVIWYSARNCKLCDSVLDQLETIDDDAERTGSVIMVKVDDKHLARVHGITVFPSLTFFRGPDEEMILFEGDLHDEQAVLAFLTSEESLTLPNKIEEVNARQLDRITREEVFVTVLFFDDSKDSKDALSRLEHIDDEADIFKIRFVRIFDRDLADEYSLPGLPTLVYFRRQIPLVYTGDLTDEPEVLEWLIFHQNSVEDEITVASVTSEELGIMVENVDNLLVLFHDKRRKSQKVLTALEEVDEEIEDRYGEQVGFVRIDAMAESCVDKNGEFISVSQRYNLTQEEIPSLVLFKDRVLLQRFNTNSSELTDTDEVLHWLANQVGFDTISLLSQ